MKQLDRVARGMFEILEKKGDVVGLRHGIELYQAIKARAWEFSSASLRQIEGIGAQLCKGIFCPNFTISVWGEQDNKCSDSGSDG